jgi:ribosomal protein S18 acetylase RimI-like enzyme
VRIERVTSVSPDVGEAVRRLLAQLSARSAPPDDAVLQRVIDASTVHLLLAIDEERRYVGMLSLVLTPLPTGLRARIEDFAVDGPARGRGVGRMLVREAVRRAGALGARDIDLTARPGRDAAVGLYESLGFARRDTDVFRLIPSEP